MSNTITPPANSYDPGTADFGDRVREMISRDLAPYGTIHEITGTIASTRRNGVLFSDVEILVEHPRFRIPVGFKATWDEEQNRPVYYTFFGQKLPFVAHNSYHDAYSDPRDEEVVKRVFGSLDAHPACTVDLSDEDGHYPWMAVGGSSSVVSLTVIAAADASVAAGAAVEMMAAVVGTSVVVYSGYRIQSLRQRWMKKKSLIEGWNRNPDKALSSVFSSPSEEADFLDVFHTAAKDHGLTNIVDVRAAALPSNGVVSAAKGDLVVGDEAAVMKNGKHTSKTFRAPVIVFETGGEHWSSRGTAYWDGRHFYYRSSSNLEVVTLIPTTKQEPAPDRSVAEAAKAKISGFGSFLRQSIQREDVRDSLVVGAGMGAIAAVASASGAYWALQDAGGDR